MKNDSETKNRIRIIAETLFAEKGFSATGIDEIARNAGITKSVIYYHYKNKDSILESIFQNFLSHYSKYKTEISNLFFVDRTSFSQEILIQSKKIVS